MTENCGLSHATLPGVQRPGSVGQAHGGVQSRPCPLTEDGWLHTGDKRQLDAKGHLRITGRVRDPFNTSRGPYVAPAPIEDRRVMNGAVEACIVIGANCGQPLGIAMLNVGAAERAADCSQRQDGRLALGPSRND